MHIEVQAIDRRASEIQETIAAIRATLGEVADRIRRIVIKLSAKPRGKQALSRCVIEVHMANGQVEVVEERQRRAGAAVRRALGRVWKAVGGQRGRERATTPCSRPALMQPSAAAPSRQK